LHDKRFARNVNQVDRTCVGGGEANGRHVEPVGQR